MKDFTERMKVAIGECLNARIQLREKQAEARKVLIGVMSQKLKVEYTKSPICESMADSLIMEGVDPIEYIVNGQVSRYGRIRKVEVNGEGLISLTLIDVESGEEVEVLEEYTVDSDTILQFVGMFG